MRLGIVHHYGWAVAVTADVDHVVVDRRRIELVGPGLPAAPIHHEGGAHEMHRSGEPLDDDQLGELVAEVRESAMWATASAFDELADELPITSISMRAWPHDFPIDIATKRRPPYESRADSVMYLRVLDHVARLQGWDVHLFDAKTVLDEAESLLGDRADEVLDGPRKTFGPPWTKDHRTALAATIVVG